MSGQTIVVALDGSAHALDALPIATTLSTILHATIRVVHVGEAPVLPADVLVRLGLGGAGIEGLVIDTRAGEPSDEIVGAAHEWRASFIVMCTHTAVAQVGRPLGRTALGVLERAPCPVLLIRPERGTAPWALRRILLPLDGTPATSAAVRPAAELARAADAEIVVLHIVAPAARPPGERGSLTAPRYLDQPQHEWPAWEGEFIERLGCICPLASLKVRMSMAHGDPGVETARFAAESGADLVVLAWRGAWEGDRAAHIKTLIRSSPCPAMVVRVDGEGAARP